VRSDRGSVTIDEYLSSLETLPATNVGRESGRANSIEE